MEGVGVRRILAQSHGDLRVEAVNTVEHFGKQLATFSTRYSTIVI